MKTIGQAMREARQKKGMPVKALADDRVFTAYYMCDVQDKAVMASNIQADITMDIIKANIDTIKDAMESLNDGEGGEDGQ